MNITLGPKDTHLKVGNDGLSKELGNVNTLKKKNRSYNSKTVAERESELHCEKKKKKKKQRKKKLTSRIQENQEYQGRGNAANP